MTFSQTIRLNEFYGKSYPIGLAPLNTYNSVMRLVFDLGTLCWLRFMGQVLFN